MKENDYDNTQEVRSQHQYCLIRNNKKYRQVATNPLYH